MTNKPSWGSCTALPAFAFQRPSQEANRLNSDQHGATRPRWWRHTEIFRGTEQEACTERASTKGPFEDLSNKSHGDHLTLSGSNKLHGYQEKTNLIPFFSAILRPFTTMGTPSSEQMLSIASLYSSKSKVLESSKGALVPDELICKGRFRKV